MVNFPTAAELSHEVYVTAPITARWGGVDYDLTTPKKLTYGVVHHWEQTIPDVEFKISAVPAAEIASRDIVNPLEDNDRGEAFAGLKRGRKTKESE